MPGIVQHFSHHGLQNLTNEILINNCSKSWHSASFTNTPTMTCNCPYVPSQKLKKVQTVRTVLQ